MVADPQIDVGHRLKGSQRTVADDDVSLGALYACNPIPDGEVAIDDVQRIASGCQRYGTVQVAVGLVSGHGAQIQGAAVVHRKISRAARVQIKLPIRRVALEGQRCGCGSAQSDGRSALGYSQALEVGAAVVKRHCGIGDRGHHIRQA